MWSHSKLAAWFFVFPVKNCVVENFTADIDVFNFCNIFKKMIITILLLFLISLCVKDMYCIYSTKKLHFATAMTLYFSLGCQHKNLLKILEKYNLNSIILN